MIDHFSKEVCEKLGYYVYRLIDPRNGETFYVGKGTGNRVFAHVKTVLHKNDYDGINYEDKDDAAEVTSLKNKRIREIHGEHLEVIHVIHKWGMSEEEAFAVEAALIDCFPGLTNRVKGYESKQGVCNVETLERTFTRPTYDEPKDFEYIIIKIRQDVIDSVADRPGTTDEIYEAVRSAWKVNFEKVSDTSKYPYVFAVVDGIVKGVYKVDKWDKHPQEEGRFLFIGEKAESKIWDEFVDKRIPPIYMKKGLASPVLYSKNKVEK